MPNGNFDFSKGPLYGKNMYLPFLIYYNFPSIKASTKSEFEFSYHISNYYIQDFFSDSLKHYPYAINSNNLTDVKRYYDTRDVIRDYESLVTEFGFSFNITKFLEMGTDIRLVAYYPGFMDPIIESFHHIFGFPGGAREFFDQYRVFVNIENHNGIRFYLDESSFSFGDIDLWLKYTFFEKKFISLAGIGAFKIPSGLLYKLSGSGYPDMAFGVLADFKPLWLLTIYSQVGVVIPFDSFNLSGQKPFPMFNGLLSIELNPTSFFSLIVQFNIKTSPIRGDKLFGWVPGWKLYDLPQINTLVGFKFAYKKFGWQFYVEEDSFTNQGADITFNLTFTHSVRFYK